MKLKYLWHVLMTINVCIIGCPRLWSCDNSLRLRLRELSQDQSLMHPIMHTFIFPIESVYKVLGREFESGFGFRLPYHLRIREVIFENLLCKAARAEKSKMADIIAQENPTWVKIILESIVIPLFPCFRTWGIHFWCCV